MATQAKVDSHQQEADALFITGAALTGIAEGAEQVIKNKVETAEN